MKFSKRTDWPAASNLVSAKLADVKTKGRAILDLTVSNPTACKFDYLNSSLLEPFLKSKNLIYEPDPRGLLETRQALCDDYQKKGILLDPRQIFLTANTSEAYSFIFRLLFEPGEMLMVPQPSYPLLSYLGQINDICREPYSLVYEKHWKMNFEKIDLPTLLEPRAVLVVNPNNPTGNFVRQAGLGELNMFCRARDMALISDEVFFDFCLEEAPKDRVSLASNSHALTFTFGGISKMLGLPQMKLSWIVVSGPEALRAKAIERLEVIADTYLSAGTPAQHAFPEWLCFKEKIQTEIITRLTANYNFLLASFGSSGLTRVFKTEGGWNAVLKLPSSLTDEEWALLFLEKERTLIHPGYLFDFEEGSFGVLSLLIPPDTFREGISRIANRLTAPLKHS